MINRGIGACQIELNIVEGRAAVSLRAFLDERGRINVQVADNGQGIAPENLEKVFVPFFSTNPGGRGSASASRGRSCGSTAGRSTSIPSRAFRRSSPSDSN